MGKVWGRVGGYYRGRVGGSGGSGDGSTEWNGDFTGELPGVVGYPHCEGMGSLRFHPGHEGPMGKVWGSSRGVK